jgi:hypothetical protein
MMRNERKWKPFAWKNLSTDGRGVMREVMNIGWVLAAKQFVRILIKLILISHRAFFIIQDHLLQATEFPTGPVASTRRS